MDGGREGGREGGEGWEGEGREGGEGWEGEGREGGRGREGRKERIRKEWRQIKNTNKIIIHFPENLPEDLMPPPETDNL